MSTMSTLLEMTARSLAALLAIACLTACSADRDGVEDGVVSPACACCDYADGICTAACDCDVSDACTAMFPSGDRETWAAYLVCFAKMSLYCRDNMTPGVPIDVCELALTAAECVETDGGPAIELPGVCVN